MDGISRIESTLSPGFGNTFVGQSCMAVPGIRELDN